MTFTLGDDGTLDTVLACDDCGETLRYNTDSLCWHDAECRQQGGKTCECYAEFIEWAKADAGVTHECGECSGVSTCVDHSEAYAEAQEEKRQS